MVREMVQGVETNTEDHMIQVKDFDSFLGEEKK